VVPLVLRDKVGEELDRLEKVGTIEKINYSRWGTPIVPVVKDYGSVRVCGDYKVTLNRFFLRDRHPLPRIDELFAKLQSCEKFSKIDLIESYHQNALDEESQLICTWSTFEGLYKVKRTPFGITSASSIFQKIVVRTLQGLKMGAVFTDDIIITGRNDKGHNANLEKVLYQLSEALRD
jgi:Reverse transcriptase (RNA-dependent DNA polymerase)